MYSAISFVAFLAFSDFFFSSSFRRCIASFRFVFNFERFVIFIYFCLLEMIESLFNGKNLNKIVLLASNKEKTKSTSNLLRYFITNKFQLPND